MLDKIQILHTIAGIHPESGGTSRVVVDLADALCESVAIQPVVITQSVQGEQTVESLNLRVQHIIAKTNSLTAIRLGLPFRRTLKKEVNKSENLLIHNHGLWMAVNHWACRIARKRNIPLVLQPHGMLEPWAVNHKAWKKRMAMTFFQRSDIQMAKAIIATSLNEYENIREMGFINPIAVIPNGVDLDIDLCLPVKKKTDYIVLFLSRIHSKKGLENLVRAWAQVDIQRWKLRIAGPDEDGHLKKIMALVGKLGIADSVEYIGVVDSKNKPEIYQSADLFVLPTFSENFGVVIAEALAYGLPVITTRGAPWADLIKYRCGWWIDIGVYPLVDALNEAMSLSDEERSNMGARGRDYVQRYNWESIAHQTIDVYRWVLKQGPKPDCVRID